MRVPSGPEVRISGAVYMKLKYMASERDTEVGYMGVWADGMLVDLWMPKQECDAAFCSFDEDDTADVMSDLVEQEELTPHQLMCAWIHTHPGDCATPSQQDEDTFGEVMAPLPWSIMLIFADGGDEYARVQVRSEDGVTLQQVATIAVDWSLLPHGWEEGEGPEEWMAEADEKVSKTVFKTALPTWKYGNYLAPLESRWSKNGKKDDEEWDVPLSASLADDDRGDWDQFAQDWITQYGDQGEEDLRDSGWTDDEIDLLTQ